MVLELNKTGPKFDQQYYKDENENWERISESFNNYVTVISDEIKGEIIDLSKLAWLPSFVDTFEDIATIYPNPSEGDTTMAREDSADYPVDENDKRMAGTIWRFDGTDWQPIMNIDPSAITGLEVVITNDINQFKTDVENTIDQFKTDVENTFDLRGFDIRRNEHLVVDGDWTEALNDAVTNYNYIILNDIEITVSGPVTISGRKKIEGNGNATIKASRNVSSFFDIINADYLDLSGILFDGDNVTSRSIRVRMSKNVTIRKCQFINYFSDLGSTVRVIDVSRYNIDGLLIEDCEFEDLYATPDGQISSDSGVCRAINFSTGTGPDIDLVKGVIIRGCSFKNIETVEDADAIGVVFEDPTKKVDITIDNNRFHNVAKRAVKAQASNIVITKNKVTRDYVEDTPNYITRSFTGNTVTLQGDLTEYGSGGYRKYLIFLSTNNQTQVLRAYLGEGTYDVSSNSTTFEVHSNYVGDSRGWIDANLSDSITKSEIRIYAMTAPISIRGRDCISSDNEVYAYSTSGLDITGSVGGSAIMKGNVIKTNSADFKHNTEGGTTRGLRISNAVGGLLDGNIVEGFYYGVGLNTASNVKVANNNIQNIHIGVETTYASSSFCDIISNDINNCTKGIWIGSSFNRSQVKMNRIFNVTEEPILLESGNRIIATENTAELVNSSSSEVVVVTTGQSGNVVRNNDPLALG